MKYIVPRLYLENELILDLASIESSEEWIIETDPNHIFYFSFITDGQVIKQHISSSLSVSIVPLLFNEQPFIVCFSKIVDVNKLGSILFPTSADTEIVSPFYSTGNAVIINLIRSSSLKGIRLKAQKVNKTVPCSPAFYLESNLKSCLISCSPCLVLST